MITAETRAIATIVAMALATSGCSGERGRPTSSAHAGGSPHLTVRDSTIFQEPPETPLGASAVLITRTSTGETYVNDPGNGILHFASTGEWIGNIGKAGTGPGEITAGGGIGLIANETRLVVADAGALKLIVFSAGTGAFEKEVRLPVPDVGQSWSQRGDTIVVAAQRASHLLAKWVPSTDRVDTIGATPDSLLRSMNAYVFYGRTEAVATDSGYLLFLPTEPGLRLLDREGRPRGFVRLPSLRRKGEPPDLLTMLSRSRGDLQPAASFAWGLGRLSTGAFVALHLDTEHFGPRRGGHFGNFRIWLSLISPDLTRACVDALVPRPTDAIAFPAFLGDTVFILSRTVTGDKGVQAVLYGITVDDTGCDWIATGGVR